MKKGFHAKEFDGMTFGMEVETGTKAYENFKKSVFDAITKDKPTLAGFLRSLPVIEAPWDGAFQERFCVECGADSCDDCPNEQFRNNPEWWLSLPAAEVEQ